MRSSTMAMTEVGALQCASLQQQGSYALVGADSLVAQGGI